MLDKDMTCQIMSRSSQGVCTCSVQNLLTNTTCMLDTAMSREAYVVWATAQTCFAWTQSCPKCIKSCSEQSKTTLHTTYDMYMSPSFATKLCLTKSWGNSNIGLYMCTRHQATSIEPCPCLNSSYSTLIYMPFRLQFRDRSFDGWESSRATLGVLGGNFHPRRRGD